MGRSGATIQHRIGNLVAMPSKKKQFDIDAGKRLRHAREALGVAQNDFAAVLDVRPQRLNNWEKGRNGAPPIELLGIWTTYGISLDFVYMGLVSHCEPATKKAIQALTVVARAKKAG